ncbi:MAG: hypothetical protein AABY22_35800 [Nanoarchaeota archaeon]
MTNKLKIIGVILKMPMFLLVLIATIASFYISINKLYDINIGTSVILLIILILDIIGEVFLLRNNIKKEDTKNGSPQGYIRN